MALRASTDPSFPEHAFDEATAAALDLDAGRGRLTHADATVRLGTTEPGPFRDPPPVERAPPASARTPVVSTPASHLRTTSVVVDRADAPSLRRTLAVAAAVVAFLAGVGAGAYTWASSTSSSVSASVSTSASEAPSASAPGMAAAGRPGRAPGVDRPPAARVALAAHRASPPHAELAPAVAATGSIAAADDVARVARPSRGDRVTARVSPNADLLTGY